MTSLQTIIEQQQERLPEGYKRFSTAGEQTPSDLIAQTATEAYSLGYKEGYKQGKFDAEMDNKYPQHDT
jgi:flagellar biosynthesis/type III secretory pathway protein FliH